jgi:oligopeptide transport system substrate-binding protein
MRLYGQAERIITEEAPILLLDYAEAVILLQPWVTRVPTSPSGFPFWSGIVIEPHGESASQPKPRILQTLSLSCGEPPTLDPSMAGDSVSIDVISQLFGGLVTLGPELDVLPDMARGWEVSADGRTYVFRLRDDARWSDGRLVTAGDFEYAWKRVLHPAVGSPTASLLYDVKGARAFNRGEEPDAEKLGVRAADDRTLVVELEEPTGYFLHLLTCPATYALPRHVAEKCADAWTEVGNIVTSGPFRLESWERGRSMTFARNPQYHGSFGGNVGQVCLVFASLQEWQSKLSLYDAGGLDVLNTSGFDPSVGADVQRRYAGSTVLRTARLGTFFLVFDVTRPPFDDPRVRRAFVMGTDKEALAGEGWMSGLRPAAGGLTPPRMPGHCEGITLPFDPARARALLAEAGYPEGRSFPVIDCLAMIMFRGQDIASNLQNQWRQNLGLEIPWKTMEWGEYVEAIRRQPPHIFYIGWSADYPDPDTFLRGGLHIQSAWRNEAYEELVEKARRVRDQGQRMGLYRQAEGILAEEAPILIAGYKESVVLTQPWVKEFPSSAIAEYIWKDVVIEPH